VPPIAALAAIRASAPFVMTFLSGGHSSRLRNAIRGAQCATFRPLIARAEKLVAVSDFEANLFSRRLRIPRDHFVIVPNGAELEAPVDVATVDRDAPLIVSVGRLERYKGHHRVIAAFGELVKRRPRARLRVCGEGPYKPQLQRLAERLGLQASVTIGGLPRGTPANGRPSCAGVRRCSAERLTKRILSPCSKRYRLDVPSSQAIRPASPKWPREDSCTASIPMRRRRRTLLRCSRSSIILRPMRRLSSKSMTGTDARTISSIFIAAFSLLNRSKRFLLFPFRSLVQERERGGKDLAHGAIADAAARLTVLVHLLIKGSCS
jgi:glycosyltransferase involved in cell wall biosynthesis